MLSRAAALHPLTRRAPNVPRFVQGTTVHRSCDVMDRRPCEGTVGLADLWFVWFGGRILVSDKTPWRNRGTQDSLLFQTEDFHYSFTWPSKSNVIKLWTSVPQAVYSPASRTIFLTGQKKTNLTTCPLLLVSRHSPKWWETRRGGFPEQQLRPDAWGWWSGGDLGGNRHGEVQGGQFFTHASVLES